MKKSLEAKKMWFCRYPLSIALTEQVKNEEILKKIMRKEGLRNVTLTRYIEERNGINPLNKLE